jgi:hypothetical protein
MATYEQISKWITSAFAHSITGGQAAVDYMSRNRVLRVRQDLDDAAIGDEWTRYLMVADKAVNITKIQVICDTTYTGADVNYMTLSFATGTAGSMTSRDSIVGDNGEDFTAATPKLFTVVTATDSLAAGELLSYSKAKTGNGLAMPAHTIEVHYNYV